MSSSSTLDVGTSVCAVLVTTVLSPLRAVTTMRAVWLALFPGRMATDVGSVTDMAAS
jgi:hypothetical protein